MTSKRGMTGTLQVDVAVGVVAPDTPDNDGDEEEAPPLVVPDTQPPPLNAIAQRAVERAAHTLSSASSSLTFRTIPNTPTTTPTTKKKRGNAFLTNAQRQALCLHATATKCTQAQLCVWARDTFALDEPLNQSTISRILADRSKFLAIDGSSLAQKRRTYVDHPELEAALAHWLLVASHGGRRVSGDAIKEKGRAFAQELGIASKIAFSNGWLTGFKKRHHAVLASGESGVEGELDDAQAVGDDSRVAWDWSVQHAIQDYDPNNVFALSVTGLLYALVPEKPARRAPEQQDRKLTLLLAVNATGSERLAPLIVGRSKDLVQDAPTSYTASKQLSNAVTATEPVFSYCYSERVWLNAVVFQRWLCTLNATMTVANRFIVLLIADAPSHITRGLRLSHVRVLRVPEATAQPLDAGIAAAFKRRYRRRQLLHALDCHEAGHASVFTIAEAQAIHWCCAAWRDVPAALVASCWADANVLGEVGGQLVAGSANATAIAAVREAEEALEQQIKDTAFRLPLRHVMALQELLSPAHESDSLHFVGASERDFLAERDELSSPVSRSGFSGGVSISAGVDPDGVSRGGYDVADSSAAADCDSSDTLSTAAALRPLDDALIVDRELLAHVQTIVPTLERLGCDDRTIQAMRDVRDTLKRRAADCNEANGRSRHSVRRSSTGV